jgi:hypothetical protein
MVEPDQYASEELNRLFSRRKEQHPPVSTDAVFYVILQDDSRSLMKMLIFLLFFPCGIFVIVAGTLLVPDLMAVLHFGVFFHLEHMMYPIC